MERDRSGVVKKDTIEVPKVWIPIIFTVISISFSAGMIYSSLDTRLDDVERRLNWVSEFLIKELELHSDAFSGSRPGR